MTQRVADLFADVPAQGRGRQDVEEAKKLLARATDYFDIVTPSGPVAPIALALAALTFAYEHSARPNSNGSGLAGGSLNTTQVESKDSTCLNQGGGFKPPPFNGIFRSTFSDEKDRTTYPPQGAGATEDLANLFADDGPPIPDVAAAFGQGPSYSPAPRHPGRFRLTPPTEPKGRTRLPDARSKKGRPFDGSHMPLMYALCYGADNAEKWRALTREQVHRVVSVLGNLVDAGADLSRLGEFKTWYNKWAAFAPAPEKVQEFWWRAMSDLDAAIPARQGPYPDESGYEAGVTRMRQKALADLKGEEGGPQW